MKSFYRAVFAAYVIILLWVILFKLSYDLYAVVARYDARSLNLIPFFGSSRGTVREMIDNVVVFIPFGLLLSVNLKQAALRRKLAIVFAFSLAAEVTQFVLAIGATDITDVITNTLGGFLGLLLYGGATAYVDGKKLDRAICVAGTVILIACVALRVLVLRVQY